MFGVFLFLTSYLQRTLGYSPVKTGLAFLPLAGTLMFSAKIAQTTLLAGTGPRPLIATGMGLAAVGTALLTGVGIGSAYATAVLPTLLLMGAGLGLTLATSVNTATLGVRASEAGLASAMVNTSRQVGGALGTALLSAVAAYAARASCPRTGLAAISSLPPRCTATGARSGARPRSFAAGGVLGGLVLRGGAQGALPAIEPAAPR
jgi:hypothetical protein